MEQISNPRRSLTIVEPADLVDKLRVETEVLFCHPVMMPDLGGERPWGCRLASGSQEWATQTLGHKRLHAGDAAPTRSFYPSRAHNDSRKAS